MTCSPAFLLVLTGAVMVHVALVIHAYQRRVCRHEAWQNCPKCMPEPRPLGVPEVGLDAPLPAGTSRLVRRPVSRRSWLVVVGIFAASFATSAAGDLAPGAAWRDTALHLSGILMGAGIGVLGPCLFLRAAGKAGSISERPVTVVCPGCGDEQETTMVSVVFPPPHRPEH